MEQNVRVNGSGNTLFCCLSHGQNSGTVVRAVNITVYGEPFAFIS